jgi:hypothetical protein
MLTWWGVVGAAGAVDAAVAAAEGTPGGCRGAYQGRWKHKRSGYCCCCWQHIFRLKLLQDNTPRKAGHRTIWITNIGWVR